METMLFRVVQECLINIHRHSGSAVASIRLFQTERQFVMEVEDEGRGMNADELSAIASGETLGVGLRGMRERISDFGGELEVLSTGRGTKVKALIPIEVRSPRAIQAQPAADVLRAGEIAKRATAH
jgi:two-component system NarL family sensor kinase